jgi:hypothetical protein
VRRQCIVSRQERQEIWDNADLTGRSDPIEAGDPVVLAAEAIKKRAFFE